MCVASIIAFGDGVRRGQHSLQVRRCRSYHIHSYSKEPCLVLVISSNCSFRVNDSGEARRRMWKEFLKRDDLPEKLQCRDVDLDERYWVNDRGMLLLTSTMVPKDNAPVRGVIFLCHGYMDNSSS